MFVNRHLGPNEKEIAQMIKTIGVNDVAQLIDETIPSDIRLKEALALPAGISEYTFQKKIQQLSQKNKLFSNYIGHNHFRPENNYQMCFEKLLDHHDCPTSNNTGLASLLMLI